MSSSFSKEYVPQKRSLLVLKDKVVSIDIAPFLYKWIYTFDTKEPNLKILNSEGVVTSHLKGFLNFVKRLKEFKITPIVCLDGNLRSSLKDSEVERRTATRKKKLEKLNQITKLGLTLTKEQEKQELHSTNFVGVKQKQLILKCCELLGIPYYIGEYVEGEAACASLKKLGVADECMSLDRDVFLYGVSFYGSYDFLKKTIDYFNLDQTLDRLGLRNEIQLKYCCIASGCDYTSGIPKVGPKNALKRIKQDPDKFQAELKEQVSSFGEILMYLEKPLSLEFLNKKDPNPIEFTNFLMNLGFREEYIMDLNSFLFSND